MWGFIPRSPLDPLLILLLGLVLDAVVGDLPVLFAALPHPVAVLGRLIAFLDQRLNRETRDARTRAARGTFVAGLVALLAALAGVLVLAVTRRLAAGWLIELFLV